jgi:type I restriction enzyme S subunit
MSKLQRYSSYKESGVEWIGEIPEHWEIEKGKWLFKQVQRPVRLNDEIVTCFRDGMVTLRSNRRTEGFTNALKEHGYQGIRNGDFVIHNMDAFAGAIGISDSDGKSTPVYTVCRPWDDKIVSSEYYARYLRNLALQDFILSLAKGIRERSTDFRYKDFGELLFPFPPQRRTNRHCLFPRYQNRPNRPSHPPKRATYRTAQRASSDRYQRSGDKRAKS